MPENSTQKQRGGFKPGQSGNPAGKPKGARHRATVMAEKLFGDAAEEVCRAVIAKAQQGDMTAARLIVERLCPPRKDRPIDFPLPALASAADAATLMTAILAGVASGEITPQEAAEVARLAEVFVRTFEATEFERRLSELEKAVTAGASPAPRNNQSIS